MGEIIAIFINPWIIWVQAFIEIHRVVHFKTGVFKFMFKMRKYIEL